MILGLLSSISAIPTYTLMFWEHYDFPHNPIDDYDNDWTVNGKYLGQILFILISIIIIFYVIISEL